MPSSTRVLRQFRVVFNAVKTHFRQVEREAGVGGAQLWALSVIDRRPGIGVLCGQKLLQQRPLALPSHQRDGVARGARDRPGRGPHASGVLAQPTVHNGRTGSLRTGEHRGRAAGGQ